MNSLGLNFFQDIDLQSIELTLNPEYSLTQVSSKTKIEEFKFKRYIKALKRKKQIIFYGLPGTGKTFLSQELAQHLIGRTYGKTELIQFHSACCYEDFMQGIRPIANENGMLTYEMVPRRFL